MSTRATIGNRLCSTVVLATLVYLPTVSTAQVEDLDRRRLPWSIFAETTFFDGKESMTVFTGLRLSQGRVAIEAEEGRVTDRNDAEGVWLFNGNVVIDVENGRIECDTANLVFEDFSLSTATVTGTPASFTLTRPGNDDVTHAEARELTYDVRKGIVEFSGEATIAEGGNQVSSDFLVYNINEQTFSADSSGEDRVRITYTPTEGAVVPNTDTPPAESAESP